MTAKARKRRVKTVLADIDTGEHLALENEVIIDPERGDALGLIDKITQEYSLAATFYLKQGSMTPEEARARSLNLHDGMRAEHAEEMPVRKLEWGHINALGAKGGAQKALEVWEAIKLAASEDVASGVYLAETVMPEASPIQRAHYFAIREEMRDGWQPQNGLEHTLVDMLALSFWLYLHWTAIVFWRTTHESDEGEKMRQQSPYNHERQWKVPRFSEGMAIDQATKLADGYNRQFLRTLRQLRDLRRYAPPVIVNNGGQVNVANQQVNVSRIE